MAVLPENGLYGEGIEPQSPRNGGGWLGATGASLWPPRVCMMVSSVHTHAW